MGCEGRLRRGAVWVRARVRARARVRVRVRDCLRRGAVWDLVDGDAHRDVDAAREGWLERVEGELVRVRVRARVRARVRLS